ncbi:MAG: FAD-dependent oxidoreductase [Kiritimatiellae bacterium]|nr:FAD-dependent oxidoreductase [Kiritimatiellia bacterium]
MKRLLTAAAFLSALAVHAARVDVSVLAFDARGWQLDSQFAASMGSPCLLAHGCGVRVLDARASVEVPESGEWRVWVRNRCWVKGAGLFKVAFDGRETVHVFGAGRGDWFWEDGGTVALEKGVVVVSLVDKDGFDGRCAGIVLTNDGTVPEGPLEPPGEVAETVVSDFTVVGGGMPGTCAAVAAARRGLRVALVQDRPVLGGNASAEIRVWCAGEARHPLVRELRSVFLNRDVNMPACDARRMRIVEDEANLAVRLMTRAVGVDRRPDGTIAAVRALDLRRNRIVRFESPLFCDATGDGWIGFWAGADWRMGREARSEHGESFAPDKADSDTLGASIMWTSAEANAPVPFSAPWAEPYAQGETAVNGEWNWEYGIHRDMIAEAEQIRDRLLLAIYGAFSRAKRLPENANRMLNFCPFLLGKRESRRLMGDWVYSERDVTEHRQFEDSVASGSWSVDLHYDDCKPGVDFLTTCRQPHFGRYWIPYRSIYSRNVGNLFMVGRCFSCTHVGLGGPRVINTLSQLGVAAGEAAAMCRRLGETPRGIFAHGHVRELQDLLGGGFPGVPYVGQAGWRIVDDESDGVTFGKGWEAAHNANGEQVGDITHFPKGANSWAPDVKPGSDIGDVVYPLPVEAPGRYALLGRVPYFYKSHPGSSTAMVVSSAGKSTPFTADQGVATGTWRRLGTFDLAPGATLRIVGARSRGTVAADGFAVVAADAANLPE